MTRSCSRCLRDFQPTLEVQRRCPVCRAPRHRDRTPAPGAPLSLRERQIADLVAAGSSNKEIAAAVRLEQDTIKSYLWAMFRKLGVSSRTQLAIRWIQMSDGVIR